MAPTLLEPALTDPSDLLGEADVRIQAASPLIRAGELVAAAALLHRAADFLEQAAR